MKYDIMKQRIKELRRSHGYTQDNLAELINVKKSTISNYETGYSLPSNKHLNSLAKLFNVKLGYILGDEDIIKADNIMKLNFYESPEMFYANTPLKTIELDRVSSIPDNSAAVRVVSNMFVRMNIYPGDVILVKRQNTVKSGDIVLYLESGVICGAKYRLAGKTQAVLEGLTDGENKITVVDINEDELNILGKIICHWRIFN